MTLVSASWTMRYAASPTPAETARGSPSVRSVDSQACFGYLGDEHREVVQPGRGCHGSSSWIVVGAKHREELAHLAHR